MELPMLIMDGCLGTFVTGPMMACSMIGENITLAMSYITGIFGSCSSISEMI
jgi:hypothetical protein